MAQQSKKKKSGGKTAAGIILVPLILAALGGGLYIAGKDILNNRGGKPDTAQSTAEQSVPEETAPPVSAEHAETTTEALSGFADKAERTTDTITVNDTTKVLARNALLIECSGNGGMETKVGEDGMLYIRGPAVLKGYYKEPERTAEVLSPDGWFRTGDIGRIDADVIGFVLGHPAFEEPR